MERWKVGDKNTSEILVCVRFGLWGINFIQGLFS